MNRMSLDEFRKDHGNHFYRSGKTSASRPDYSAAKTIFETVRQIRGLQRDRPPIVFDGAYELDVEVYGPTRADEDNIRKAINDALQGCATRNDRDSQGGITKLHRGYN